MTIRGILKSFDHTQKIMLNRHTGVLLIRVHSRSASPGLTGGITCWDEHSEIPFRVHAVVRWRFIPYNVAAIHILRWLQNPMLPPGCAH